ncbi:MAG: glycosyl hydrolase family 65 protein [Bacteroidota bacterium]|nr:glycosyl hydrolase family 65 protein [Bacteroidota bacterium]
MSKEITPSHSFHPWSLEYYDYDPAKEKSRESLLAIGNGYLGCRGAMEETTAGEFNYAGTYVAGLYNRLTSKVADRDIENEDFVNCPNWLSFKFRINDDSWIDIGPSTIQSIKRILDFRTGVLLREMILRDKRGQETKITSRRIASMANPHVLALQYEIEPLNYSGTIEISSGLDGTIINDGVERYRQLNQHHLSPLSEGGEGALSWLVVRTTQSNIEIAEASRLAVAKNNYRADVNFEHDNDCGKVLTQFQVDLKEGDCLSVEKVVVLYDSGTRDSGLRTVNPVPERSRRGDSGTLELCFLDLDKAGSFNDIVAESEKSWKEIWDKIDIQIDGDPKSQMLIRLHLYHLMVTASPHNENIDAGIPARGLHGEAYRGHIFWDELYILPLYHMFLPEVAKSILSYRYKRLDLARDYAKEYGFAGSMFPWQSGSDGREETQTIHLNPNSGEWGDDYSSLQRHISIAIAYNTWSYFQITDDLDFMIDKGAELFLEICRFWASKSEWNEIESRFNIKKVMGPDEFHEEHPASPGGGVKDNAYTNIMVAWLFEKAAEIWKLLPDPARNTIAEKIFLESNEIDQWSDIAKQLNVLVSPEGIISQFDGYFELAELDWNAYRKKYDNIYRLDRILKAEGKSPDDYKLAKQADTLMTYYNLDEEVISGLLKRMGYTLNEQVLKKNYEYYINRTSHGSTLSRVVHAYLANMLGDPDLGWQLYSEALESDYTDIQGGTTAEGIHAGVMGGTVLMTITSFAGINFKHACLKINPNLPKKWNQLRFGFTFKKSRYLIAITSQEVELKIENDNLDLIEIELSDKKISLQTNQTHVIKY